MLGHGFHIERFDLIDSTNTYLMGKAREGAPGGLVAVADHQLAGRGRLDRRWEAPPGSSLLASILLREHLEPGTSHLLTAAVALSGAAAVERLCGLRPGLKWPNDLVIGGAKVAGVLAEADTCAPGGGPGTTAVVVGIGMNLTWPGPPGVGGTSLLAASGVVVDRDLLLDELLGELSLRLDLLRTAVGRETLTEDLRGSLVTLGTVVSVETPGGTVVGRARSISTAGHLVVEVGDDEVEIVTGDVVHVRPASEGQPGAD